MKKPLLPIAATAAAATLAMLAGCSSLTPADDPVYLKLNDLEARLIRIEKVVQNESLIQLATDLQQVQSDVKALRGELDTLKYNTENSADRQRELYVDVDRRLQALEQGQQRVAAAPPPPPASASGQGAFPPAAPSEAPPAAPSTQPPAAAARPTGNDQQTYQAAFDLIQARRYDDARKAFADFLTAFPQSPLADNAQYWLAETHYVQRQFAEALPEFQKVIDDYPQSSKMPDAMLKVGYCNYELKNKAAARTVLQQVMHQFPDTTAARLAAQRLEKISQEGG